MSNRLLITLVLIAPLSNAGELTDILNYHEVDANLATAGQVEPDHVQALADAGFELVINLAPADLEQNQQEAFLVAQRGITYVNIPVDWEHPTEADLQLFYAFMGAGQGRKTLVHCFANYRASAFTYAYRVKHGGVPANEARIDLYAVWTNEAFERFPQWAELVSAVSD